MPSEIAINLHASTENLHSFLGKVHTFAAKNGFEHGQIMQIELVLEEIFINICTYAFPKGDACPLVKVKCSFKNNKLIITFEDSGVSFDLTGKPDPDMNLPAEERPIGGLGIFLVKQITDKISYKRIKNKNYLELVFNK